MIPLTIYCTDNKVTLEGKDCTYELLAMPEKRSKEMWVAPATAKAPEGDPCSCVLILFAEDVLTLYVTLGHIL